MLVLGRKKRLDKTPPSVPSSLVVSGSSLTHISLSWGASTDNRAGIMTYELYRNNIYLTQVTGVTYTNSGLSVGTYSYKIRAKDAKGNLSNYSATVSHTIADTASPSTPSLSATGVQYTSVNLSWSAATDNVGVTGYQIIRNGGVIANIGNTTSYTDNGLTTGTSYSYQVKARDAAGNYSAVSNTASATPPYPSWPGWTLARSYSYSKSGGNFNYVAGQATYTAPWTIRYMRVSDNIANSWWNSNGGVMADGDTLFGAGVIAYAGMPGGGRYDVSGITQITTARTWTLQGAWGGYDRGRAFNVMLNTPIPAGFQMKFSDPESLDSGSLYDNSGNINVSVYVAP